MTATHNLADRLDALLPQTQCRQCGYEGCRPYAEAMATDGVAHNRCPPGGARGIDALAALLGREPLELDPACGIEGPRTVAVIDEPACVGCTKCIQACPVDAIVGAANLMHAVIAGECTGCGLCVPPCPTDCIAMVRIEPEDRDAPAWRAELADRAARGRVRWHARRARLARDAAEQAQALAAKRAAQGGAAAAALQAALARAKAARDPA